MPAQENHRHHKAQPDDKVNKINVNWIQRISGMKNKVDVKAIRENQGGIEDAHMTSQDLERKINKAY